MKHTAIVLVLFFAVIAFVETADSEVRKKKKPYFGYHGYHLLGLLVALKLKFIFVGLAIWGGAMLLGKLLVAGLVPLVHMMTHKKCHHPIEFEHIYRSAEVHEDDHHPGYPYKKPWNRRIIQTPNLAARPAPQKNLKSNINPVKKLDYLHRNINVVDKSTEDFENERR